METATKERLFSTVGYGPEQLANLSRARVLGCLINRAHRGPTMTYASDFYHDAQWLQRYFERVPFTFHYAYNELGTQIGDNLQYLKDDSNYTEVLICNVLVEDAGIVYLTMEPM